MGDNPVSLNQVFHGIRNYEYMYSNFSVSLLEVISYLPEFKVKKENEIFDIEIENRLFKIRVIKPSLGRKLVFRIDDETISTREFFLFASYCLSKFQEKIDL